MKDTKKSFLRATKESAQKAVEKHIEKMEKKGWQVGTMFGGESGIKYRMSVEFYK